MRGAAQGTTRVESRYTIQTCDPSVSRTAVRWGPQFFFERPAKIPRSFLRSFSLWARLAPIATTNLPVDSRDSIFPSFDTYTNVLNDLTAIFRLIAVFMGDRKSTRLNS